MSKSRLSEKELRSLRKDMLRARVQLERHSLARGSRHLANDLSPGSLLRSVLPVGLTSKRPSDWLFEGVGLVRRYPYLFSAASAIFSGVRRRRRLWHIGAGLALSWALTRAKRKEYDDEHA
ncbi:hypothetical protein H0484_12650 [Pusillimonas sp. CC-YST705]|uniref:DUF3618 domain-containing protein n=1 Tax=Mesopusillimonas faecipullorum TaxID=2755040 RepID=A0ABS8CEW8_9BURK|nr:hypothetical protein [Mesopusillimonas faecipullorum]MCB5364597.1 hypothetical protein [Mesopusillimonas faecipullorum]